MLDSQGKTKRNYIGIVLRSTCCFPAGIYLLKVNKRNTRKRCEIFSELTIKTTEQRQ